MTCDRNADMRAAEPIPIPLRLNEHAGGWYRLVSRFFASKPISETVATRVRFDASPEAIWNRILFYEEVPGRPPFLLRTLLPHPVRTDGDKTRVGATVHCAYRGGDLVKRITAVEPPHLLQFEVIEQRLGIEGCILTVGGSYQICAKGDVTDVVLTTNYRAYLRPRCLWHPLEALLVSQLHRHILRGVCAAGVAEDLNMRGAAGERLTPGCIPPGGPACTASPSCSRR
jgi:hypothetical protein